MRTLLTLLFLTFLCTCGSAQRGLLKAGPMLGYCEQREVMIWVQTTEPAAVAIVYTDSLGKSYRTAPVMTLPQTAHVAKLVADRVLPGQHYTYQVEINGEVIALPYPTAFTAQPIWRWRQDPPDFTVALGSCTYVNEPEYDRPGAGYGSEYEIFTSINRAQPDLMVWLGDNMYLREPDWYTRTGYFHRYSHTRALPEMQALLARTHHYATWDDHDYGPNNSDRTWVQKELAKETFDLFWGNLTSGLPGNGGITSTFRYNDTDFFLLDNRSFRTPNDQKRPDNKTLLGEQQLEWLIESLISSDSPWKMVCIGGQVLNTHRGGSETYVNLAPAELEYLLRRITEEDISGVVFLTGDRHHTEMSQLKLANGKMVYDLTISSLTAGTGSSRDEQNNNRVAGTLQVRHNFGLLSFAGPLRERRLTVEVFATDGSLLWKRELTR
ncbi:alkaline phosphatase D family protein [Neolewinella lacunae]|uniref:Alkaline phosphatase D family protein n=1 Tax=Neolewinella lacunae TaxID=1517758 RepID=A0A923PNL8_9BACT|nr:alkaline phosphatase D family protein [Neolewinella lacunae]MBC6996764.1 alkaline phosphatase D family protein [Neolewinella lacunae]MDN3633884.1 alkaline phosphatase D family protein [Neolewinella lacunae]